MRDKFSGFAGGRVNFVCQCLHTVYTAYPGCIAPTGLKQQVFLLTHRLRSGLLMLHPDGVSLPCPVRGNTIVAHCVRKAKLVDSFSFQSPRLVP
jgi:hypothetical protein